MLIRAFGAGSFGRFWQTWNPIFGCGLGKYIYSPLRRFLPPAVTLNLTFAVTGAIHLTVILVSLAVALLAEHILAPGGFSR